MGNVYGKVVLQIVEIYTSLCSATHEPESRYIRSREGVISMHEIRDVSWLDLSRFSQHAQHVFSHMDLTVARYSLQALFISLGNEAPGTPG